MRYVFVPGKNPELSKAEIREYLKARNIGFELLENAEDFMVLKCEKLDDTIIDNLGGTLKIGEVLEETDLPALFSELPEKALFAVSNYGQDTDAKELAETLKKKMKEAGIKAGYVHSDVPITHTDILKKKLLQKGAEFLACKGQKSWLARTIAVHDPFEFRKRDLERPVQRAMYSIPPRLARMMVNLTGIAKGTVLDPFCGIGGILQEAVLSGLQVRGVDIDKDAVEGCRKNLAWLEKNYKLSLGDLDEKVIVADARRLSERFAPNSIDAIATEPYLGRALKERPDIKEAKERLEKLGPLYEQSLAEMAKILKPHGRIVIVCPFFETEKEPIGLDMAGMAAKNGLKLIARYPDFEERHRTLRMINVLEKG